MEERKKGETPAQKRLEEAETQLAETKRAFSVAMAKIGHASIEMVEKIRKQSLISSLTARIDFFGHTAKPCIDLLAGVVKIEAQMDVQLSSSLWRDWVQSLVDTYKSIRKDIKDNLKVDGFEELFPERPTYSETPTQATTVIGQLGEQLGQLKRYLGRYSL